MSVRVVCDASALAALLLDAGSVALAEYIETPLITLDRRMSPAPGLRCTLVTPERGMP